jgi:hypothetical protein
LFVVLVRSGKGEKRLRDGDKSPGSESTGARRKKKGGDGEVK